MAVRFNRIRVLDILAEINGVGQIMQGKDFNAYTREMVKRRAIERCVEIISEASRHIPIDVKAKYPGYSLAKDQRDWQSTTPRVRAGGGYRHLARGRDLAARVEARHCVDFGRPSR